VVVIQGSDERAAGEVTIKDLVEGTRLAAGIADHAQYTEERPAQVTVAEARLVDTVRGMLARQD
jgi:histidyl-tRNA synthetase